MLDRAAVTRRRITFVDLLRLVAAFQMVVGHTIDGLLSDELRHGPVFDAWTSVRGLTGVAFLVAAGMSFHLSTLVRFETHKGDPAAVRRRLRRGASLVAIGYALHFPLAAFWGDSDAALREFAIADVLQCIGLSILALEGLTLLAKRPAHVVWASAALGASCIALGPLGDLVQPEGPFRFALNYLGHGGGSLFPLLPWAGFAFAGVTVSAIALPDGVETEPAVPGRRIALLALVVLALGIAASSIDVEEVSRNARPAFNLVKLAAILGVVAALAWIGRTIPKMPAAASILAGETLALYVSHLMVLYAGGVGLTHLIGHALSWPEAILAALAMVTATAAAGLVWHRGKAAFA